MTTYIGLNLSHLLLLNQYLNDINYIKVITSNISTQEILSSYIQQNLEGRGQRCELPQAEPKSRDRIFRYFFKRVHAKKSWLTNLVVSHFYRHLELVTFKEEQKEVQQAKKVIKRVFLGTFICFRSRRQTLCLITTLSKSYSQSLV